MPDTDDTRHLVVDATIEPDTVAFAPFAIVYCCIRSSFPHFSLVGNVVAVRTVSWYVVAVRTVSWYFLSVTNASFTLRLRVRIVHVLS